MIRVGQNAMVYGVCRVGGKITKHMAIYCVYIRSWPTLRMSLPTEAGCSPGALYMVGNQVSSVCLVVRCPLNCRASASVW
jgi:hypothetical protein